ncbi:MAG TPA: phosphatidate cytidylyltransferase [Candidatus Omnitrophota bacterium]|nr:phosphatidate cytidylyltransferase [Candidatus Omnitrophota bacterium]
MDKLIRRTLVSCILIPLVGAIVYLSPQWLFCAVVATFVGFGQFEFFKMVEHRGVFVYKYFGTVVGTLVPLVIYLGYAFPDVTDLEPLLIILASLFVFVLQLIRKDNNKDHLVSMAVTLFSMFYISWFFSFLIKFRFLANGANLITFLIMVTKGADIGAYLGGSYFGKNELIPRISPKKTKEGTLSGIIFSMMLAMLFGPFLTGFGMIHAAVIGAVLAVIGQVGDLAESLIKRDCGVKDSGGYFADIGGVLDLIDSLLFTVPVFYLYIKTL